MTRTDTRPLAVRLRAGRLTKAELRMLTEATNNPVVKAYMQRRRMCERLEAMGLLEGHSLYGYSITDAGREALRAGRGMGGGNG